MKGYIEDTIKRENTQLTFLTDNYRVSSKCLDWGNFCSFIEWNRIGAFYCFSLGVYLWPCCRRTTTPFFCVAWRQMQQLFLRQQKQLPSCNDFHLQSPPQLLPHGHGWANLSWSSGGAFPRKRGHYQRFPNWANEYALAHWTQIFFREDCKSLTLSV